MRKIATAFLILSLTMAYWLQAAALSWSAEEGETPVGRKVENFTLKDFRGKQHSLDDWSQSKLVVVAFLGTECPLARLYGPRLMELAARYADRDVAVIGIDSNRQDSVTEIGAFARVHGIDFPLLKDVGNRVADRFGAVRTPEVFVLDQNRTVRYWGRVDDQYGFDRGVGYQQPKPTRRDLAEALNELLEGKVVSQPLVRGPGCHIGRIREVDPNSEVTYSNQIARILQNRCVECHREGQIAPFALTEYEEVVGWAEMIEEVVREQRMPPWHADARHGVFSNDSALAADEKELIYQWVAAGAPQGDPSQLPEPRQFNEGWMMPEEPDAIVHMSEEPFDVSADGVVQYQYFTVDPGFTEDKWVKVAECMPDNRAVVHHIIVFAQPPKGERSANRDIRGFNFVSGFAPGTRPFVYPDGMAKLIPAGSKLVFQLHYTPIGSPQKDRSSIGLKFVDPAEVEYQVATTNTSNHLFEIPAGQSNYEVTASKKISRDMLLLSLFPHMHLRGKSFRYEAVYPDGSEEILLDVPRYDFNWQNHFILAEPKLFPKGTKLNCTAVFDNSADNLANPDPSQDVRWGDQTWEEMMIGWYDMALPVDEAQSLIASEKDGP